MAVLIYEQRNDLVIVKLGILELFSLSPFSLEVAREPPVNY